MTRVPIACTLTADAALDRIAEWKAFLSTMVHRLEKRTNQATLTLRGGSDVLLMITDLAEREKACCPFFEFSIEWDGVESRLHVEVPNEAGPILTELLQLVPAQLQPD